MLRESGAPEEEIAAAVEGATQILWPVNVKPLRLFALCSTQWRWAGGEAGPRRVGLDYAGVEAAARAAGLRLTPRLFGELRFCEQVALEAFA